MYSSLLLKLVFLLDKGKGQTETQSLQDEMPQLPTLSRSLLWQVSFPTPDLGESLQLKKLTVTLNTMATVKLTCIQALLIKKPFCKLQHKGTFPKIRLPQPSHTRVEILETFI